jgi:hypothetical protein
MSTFPSLAIISLEVKLQLAPVRRPLALVCDGVGGALGATLGREARAGGGKPRAWRCRVGAGKREWSPTDCQPCASLSRAG